MVLRERESRACFRGSRGWAPLAVARNGASRKKRTIRIPKLAGLGLSPQIGGGRHQCLGKGILRLMAPGHWRCPGTPGLVHRWLQRVRGSNGPGSFPPSQPVVNPTVLLKEGVWDPAAASATRRPLTRRSSPGCPRKNSFCWRHLLTLFPSARTLKAPTVRNSSSPAFTQSTDLPRPNWQRSRTQLQRRQSCTA